MRASWLGVTMYRKGVVTPLLCALIVLLLVVYNLVGEHSENFTNEDVHRFWQDIHPDITQSDVIPMDPQLGYDSRLLPALWLHRLLGFLETEEQHFSIPFSWGDYVGENYDIVSEKEREAALISMCLDPATHDCLVSDTVDGQFSAPFRKLLGQQYLIKAGLPLKVLFLGLQGKHSQKGLQIDLSPGKTQLLADSYCKNARKCQIELAAQAHRLRELWNTLEARATSTSGIQVCDNHESADARILTASDFQPEDYSQAPTGCSTQNDKYFHEARLIGTSVGSHYDWRFFQRAQYSELEHKTVLHRLARAWLRFSRVAGLQTWLAHGSLLGWYWNGMSMPWDDDIDIQMTLRSLHSLARRFNQTIVVDCNDDPRIAGAHLYYIDVSPHIGNRSLHSTNNVIDARFIDIHTGMYVDITALSIADAQEVTSSTKSAVKLHAVFDPEYAVATKSAAPSSSLVDEYLRRLKDAELRSCKEGQLLSCKSGHFYHVDELVPLFQTHFEGAKAFVPHEFEKVLVREYPKGLRLRHFNDWVFRPFLLLWVPKRICAGDQYGDTCQDKETSLEHRHTEGIRLSRGKWFEGVKDQPRVDPFMVHRNEVLNRKPTSTGQKSVHLSLKQSRFWLYRLFHQSVYQHSPSQVAK